MRQIDADELLKDIYECVVFTESGVYPSAEIRGANKIIDRIKAAPSVDAVQVVRCKDCRYCMHHPDSFKTLLCTNKRWSKEFLPVVDGDHFCTYGEREKGENDV